MSHDIIGLKVKAEEYIIDVQRDVADLARIAYRFTCPLCGTISRTSVDQLEGKEAMICSNRLCSFSSIVNIKEIMRT